ncbi:MAG TPA: DUF4388 domain-containing protein [bacterium]|nr:DUF4388 domain-containing protein [bacterium]
MALKGDLETINLPDILQLLSSARKTGALSIRRGAEEKRLYFREGMLVYASSTDEREKLGSVLVREGHIDQDTVEGMRASQNKSGRPFGLCLLEHGKLPHEKLVAGLKTQGRMIITNLFSWWGGEFEFLEGEQAWPEEISIGFDVQAILMDAAAAVDEWNRIKEMLPDLDVVLEVVPAPARGKEEVKFDAEQWHVLSLVNGRRSVVDVAAVSNLSDIETCSVACRLLEGGLVRPAGVKNREITLSAAETSGAAALLEIYNELFAQVIFPVSEEAGEEAVRKLSEAAAAKCDALARLKGCWQLPQGVLGKRCVLKNLILEDPETRDEELAASLFELFRYELSLTAKILSRPRQAALIQDLQPLAAMLLKKHDSKLVDLGVRRVLSRFLSPTEVSYAEAE